VTGLKEKRPKQICTLCKNY